MKPFKVVIEYRQAKNKTTPAFLDINVTLDNGTRLAQVTVAEPVMSELLPSLAKVWADVATTISNRPANDEE